MPRLPCFGLDHLLERNSNNLDLFRLICACTVIFGHAFVLVNDPAYPLGKWDPCQFLRYEGVYSASVAVKVFFFISGLLVTNSLLEKKSLVSFILSRFFRIWPAYGTVLLLTAFVIGPVFSLWSPADYFAKREVYGYPLYNLLMLPLGQLPGVFVDNPLPRMVNGALWTLPYEIAAYLILLWLFLLGIHRNFLLCTGIVLFIAMDLLLSTKLFPWTGLDPQVSFLPLCFAFGAYVAVMKHRIVIGGGTVVTLIGVFLLLKSSGWGPWLFFISVFVTVLYLSGLSWVRRLKLPFDCSYGTYLWGFVIQQMVAAKLSEKGLVFNLFLSLGLALTAGILSWYLIEKPAIKFGYRLGNSFNPPTAERSPPPVLAATESIL